MKKTVLTLIIAFTAGLGGAFVYDKLVKEEKTQPVMVSHPQTDYGNYSTRVAERNYPASTVDASEDFVFASSKSTPSVVYIKTLSETRGGNSFYDLFFGGRVSQTVSSGSGVIFTSNGYIITNYHVIKDSDEINVIINKDEYPARVVGSDPNTDLAVLKVEETNLPNIELGDSKEVEVGEWVLAVGNPFNLTSTVTAGIVSAKGRDINILKSQFSIESFIQTDAAINPGNSGGALVNMKGELVGINTAILSKTGSYAGYGFAIPIDIVKKTVEDIIGYGEVQKAFLGADVLNIDQEIATQLNLSDRTGVIVSYIQSGGAADKAGIEKGDVLVSIDDQNIESRSDYSALIGSHYPGDKVSLKLKRGNKVLTKDLVLTNREGTTDLLKREIYNSKSMGADFEVVSKVERDVLDISSGIKITEVRNGLIRRLGIEKGFIITAVNREPVKSPKELENILGTIKGKVIIQGVNSRGVKGFYSYNF